MLKCGVMNLSKKLHVALLLAVVFSASFSTVFVAIFISQSAYSIPSSKISTLNGLDVVLGPPPNSTNVPLDTTIVVDALSSASLDDLRLSPEVPINRVDIVVSGTLSYERTFYPAQPLKPATSYNVSVTIVDVPVSWSFITTSEPFNPGISFYLATNVLWIALSAAASATLIVGVAIWLKKKRG
jgi:hypothetical protein